MCFVCVCASSQIFMRYGRQRWKLRGRIEINAKQVWDSEEMVFLPLINDFLSVKVSFILLWMYFHFRRSSTKRRVGGSISEVK